LAYVIVAVRVSGVLVPAVIWALSHRSWVPTVSTYVLKAKSAGSASVSHGEAGEAFMNAWPPGYVSVEPYHTPLRPVGKTIAYTVSFTTLRGVGKEKWTQPAVGDTALDADARAEPVGLPDVVASIDTGRLTLGSALTYKSTPLRRPDLPAVKVWARSDPVPTKWLSDIAGSFC
jgi:hypothetical protein